MGHIRKFAIIAIAVASLGCAGVATELVVPTNFPTIGEAVRAAAPGDVIRLRSGTYKEAVHLSVPLTLRGDLGNPGSVIVQAPSFLTPAISVNTGTQTGTTTIEGLTVTGAAAERGILVEGSSVVVVQSSVMVNNLVGVEAAGTSIVTILDCVLRDNYDSCTQASDHSSLLVTGCIVSGTAGMQLVRSVSGASARLEIKDSTLAGTNVSRVLDHSFGVALNSGSSAVIRHCTFEHFEDAVEVWGGDSIAVEDCRIEGCCSGIVIWNQLGDNTRTSLLQNTILDCDAGVQLTGGCGLVEISRNFIRVDWQSIVVHLSAGCRSPHDVPFTGTIVGTLNDLDPDGCPSYRSPLWPTGFVK